MKILFVCSGNKLNNISPIIYSQGESLKKINIDIEYFLIKGKGIFGYLKNIFPLRKKIKKNNYTVIHSHYSFSALVSLLTFTKIPKVVSLMGSDSYGIYNKNGTVKKLSFLNRLITHIIIYFSDYIIVKSENIEKSIKLRIKDKIKIIPNGVDLNKFNPIDKKVAREKLNLDHSKKYILFMGDKNNMRKNFALAENAFKRLDDKNIILLNPYPVDHSLVPLYLNAVDVLLLTSYNEGSPNIIKEAMACNCPIVATDVGDIKWIFGNTEGCFLTLFNPDDVAYKLKLALEFVNEKNRTKGRERIISIGLDNISIAKKIHDIYFSVSKL